MLTPKQQVLNLALKVWGSSYLTRLDQAIKLRHGASATLDTLSDLQLAALHTRLQTMCGDTPSSLDVDAQIEKHRRDRQLYDGECAGEKI